MAVFLNHRDWKIALRNKSLDNGMLTTPVRKMITYMPGNDKHSSTLITLIDGGGKFRNERSGFLICVNDAPFFAFDAS